MMKEIFVFGAGASAASADTPLGAELVWNYHRDTGLLKPIINGVPDNSAENIRFRNFQKFFELVACYFPKLEMEKDLWEKRGISFYGPHSLNKNHYVDKLLRILQEENNVEGTRLIKQLIFEHITGASLSGSNMLYKDFIAKVLKCRTRRSVTIISFNFDYLLFEDFRNGVCFDYLIDFDSIDPHRAKIYKKQNPIPLIKLNGSLDWGVCQSCDRLFLFFQPKGTGFLDKRSCENDCKGGIEPFIIMPYQKYGDRISRLWNEAESELNQAKKVTIIGYSFPEYDQKVIDLFDDSLHNDIELAVVDYCESENNRAVAQNRIEKKYRRMFPHLNREAKIRMDGFNGYMKDF